MISFYGILHFETRSALEAIAFLRRGYADETRSLKAESTGISLLPS
jgi:hypothetical protein